MCLYVPGVLLFILLPNGSPRLQTEEIMSGLQPVCYIKLLNILYHIFSLSNNVVMFKFITRERSRFTASLLRPYRKIRKSTPRKTNQAWAEGARAERNSGNGSETRRAPVGAR